MYKLTHSVKKHETSTPFIVFSSSHNRLDRWIISEII